MVELPRLTDKNIIPFINSLVEQLGTYLTHIDEKNMTSDMAAKWKALSEKVSEINESAELRKSQIQSIAYPVGAIVLWSQAEDASGVMAAYGGKEWQYQGSVNGGMVSFYIYTRIS